MKWLSINEGHELVNLDQVTNIFRESQNLLTIKTLREDLILYYASEEERDEDWGHLYLFFQKEDWDILELSNEVVSIEEDESVE